MLIKILLVIRHRHHPSPRATPCGWCAPPNTTRCGFFFIVGFSLLSGRTPRAAAHGLRVRGHSALVVRLSGDRGLGMSVDRRDVRPQAVQIHRPPEPAAAVAQQTHPTAVLRTEEKARSRFSKELHDGLGPLLSSARMSLSALSREERSAGPARDHRQYDLCDRRGDPFAARDIEQPFAACAQRFRTGARRAELHRQERGDARREDTLHDEPPHGALRYGYRGDPLPRDLRADKQLCSNTPPARRSTCRCRRTARSWPSTTRTTGAGSIRRR